MGPNTGWEWSWAATLSYEVLAFLRLMSFKMVTAGHVGLTETGAGQGC